MSENLGRRFCPKTCPNVFPKLGVKILSQNLQRILPQNLPQSFPKESEDSHPKLDGGASQEILHSSAPQTRRKPRGKRAAAGRNLSYRAPITLRAPAQISWRPNRVKTHAIHRPAEALGQAAYAHLDPVYCWLIASSTQTAAPRAKAVGKRHSKCSMAATQATAVIYPPGISWGKNPAFPLF